MAVSTQFFEDASGKFDHSIRTTKKSGNPVQKKPVFAGEKSGKKRQKMGGQMGELKDL
jgi:hypothetical protein